MTTRPKRRQSFSASNLLPKAIFWEADCNKSAAAQAQRASYPVNKDNVVEQRPVTIGPRVGELRAIDRGLKPDDRVVVAGILRAVPGQKVNPQLETITPPGTPSGTPAGAPPAGAGAK